MTKPRSKRAYDRVVIEAPRDTAARHAGNYVTERERRLVRTIRDRQAAGLAVTPAQHDFVVSVEAALKRRGEI